MNKKILTFAWILYFFIYFILYLLLSMILQIGTDIENPLTHYSLTLLVGLFLASIPIFLNLGIMLIVNNALQKIKSLFTKQRTTSNILSIISIFLGMLITIFLMMALYIAYLIFIKRLY